MPLQIRRVLEESVSIALVLLVWSFLSIIATGHGEVQFAILLGGLIMAGLYAVVRGVRMAHAADPAYADPDAGSVLRENGRAILAGAPWFALALFGAITLPALDGLGLPILDDGLLVRSATQRLVQVFAFTGVLTVLLVAVASGTRAVRRRSPLRE